MASPTHETAFAFFPGLARWARVVDDKFHAEQTPSGTALGALPEAYAHVQSASPLGRWMYAVSRDLDASQTYNHYDLCKLTESMVPASSPFGIWMREVSARIFVG